MWGFVTFLKHLLCLRQKKRQRILLIQDSMTIITTVPLLLESEN